MAFCAVPPPVRRILVATRWVPLDAGPMAMRFPLSSVSSVNVSPAREKMKNAR